ncbi:MAG: rod shape-determining protein [Ruminococcus sp.]|nr:rod shape-determining protein [Ruminococcus sp.]MBQ7132986.1 rod shape-determining protein [Ruminococcus sp.]
MDIALDLGTANTRICIEHDGKVIDEPSVISYDKLTNEILTFGSEAYQMLGRTSNRIDVVFPLESSVIAESSLVEELVNIFLCEVCSSKVVMPRVLACIPGEITEVQKRAIVNAISSFGVRRVLLLESAKAAAFGCGKDIMSPHGAMVVDMGAGSADIAVMTLGGVSVGKTIKTAGNAMDEEIIKYARRQHNLIIGKAMARSCKEAIGTVMYENEERTFRIKGRDAVRGLPKFVDIKSSEIMEVIFDIAKNIAVAIADVLEDTPPELLSDIHTDGITITGGLSKLRGMRDLVENATNIKVTTAIEPSDCVVNGLFKAIDYIDEAEAQKNSLNPLMMVY